MVFPIVIVTVPIVVFWLLPPWLAWLAPGRPGGDRLLLATGCFCYFISWFLPSPLIEGEDTQFTSHVVGGGIFSGFVWLYGMRQLGWKLSPFLELLTLYLVVSALGVANELFEWAITQARLVKLTPCDTWWDLVANTAGALAFWLVYRMVRLRRGGKATANGRE